MKRAKRIYLLLGVLAVVCVAAFAVLKYEEQKELISNSGQVILEVDSDAVQSLSWSYDDQSLAFHRDDTWLYDDDEAFPVDEEKINALLEHFQAFTAAFLIEDVTDFAQYGLDAPVCTIQLSTGDTSYEIQLGDYSTMDSQRYVSIGDGNVYLVADDPMDAFEITLSDLIRHDETPDFDQVERIQFTGSEDYQVVYNEDNSSYTYCSDDVYFKEEGDTLLPLDTSLVNGYLNSLSNLHPTNYVTYNASDEDLATYGLDDPELTVTVHYTAENDDGEESSDVFTIHISRDPEERAASAGETEDTADTAEEEEEEITAYVRIGESKIIYKISGSNYETLMAASYDDLRHQEVFTADFADVTGLDITLEGTDYTITTQGTGEDKTFRYGEEELTIDDLQDALEGLTATSFTEESPTQKEEIRLTVYLDNETFPQVEIALYRYDGEQCLAVVDGSPLCLVSRSSVVDLIEAVNTIVL